MVVILSNILIKKMIFIKKNINKNLTKMNNYSHHFFLLPSLPNDFVKINLRNSKYIIAKLNHYIFILEKQVNNNFQVLPLEESNKIIQLYDDLPIIYL